MVGTPKLLWPHFTSCHSVAVSQLHSVTVTDLDEASGSRSSRPGPARNDGPGDIVNQDAASWSSSCSTLAQLLRSPAMGLTGSAWLVCGYGADTARDESTERPNNRAPKICAGQVDSSHLVRHQVNAWSTPGQRCQAAPLFLFGSVAACQPG
jgi:hypothetical protein